jgi:ABC-2 type transport system ATP-binding protein
MPYTTTLAARLDGAVKRYGVNTALAGIDLSIERGKVTALLGPNGAGKTTAIALMLGLVGADAGRVELMGESPRRLSARRRVGVMLQSAVLPETLRVGELLELTSGYYPRPRPLRESAAMADIGDLLRQPYGRLSGGQKRRVQFALAICGNPELIFLDEPTTGLDIDARMSVWAVVRRLISEGCAVLLTTHYLEEAESLAQRVAVLVCGRIVTEGSVEEIRTRGARSNIRCVSAIPVDEVRRWTEVAAARLHEGRLDIETTAAEPVLRRLLDADPLLREVEVHRAGLADAFIQITQAERHVGEEYTS